MKKLLSILCALMLVSNLSAQQFGFKAGLDLTDLSLSSQDTSLPSFDMGTAYSAGIFGVFELSDVLQLKPELLYAHRSSSSSFNVFGITAKTTFKMDYIEVPINLGYLISDEFSINAGPYVGLLLKSTMIVEVLGQTQEEDMKEELNSLDYGLNLGASYNLNENIVINAGYTLGLANLVKDSSDDTLKASGIRLSFGYIIGGAYY